MESQAQREPESGQVVNPYGSDALGSYLAFRPIPPVGFCEFDPCDQHGGMQLKRSIERQWSAARLEQPQVNCFTRTKAIAAGNLRGMEVDQTQPSSCLTQPTCRSGLFPCAARVGEDSNAPLRQLLARFSPLLVQQFQHPARNHIDVGFGNRFVLRRPRSQPLKYECLKQALLTDAQLVGCRLQIGHRCGAEFHGHLGAAIFTWRVVNAHGCRVLNRYVAVEEPHDAAFQSLSKSSCDMWSGLMFPTLVTRNLRGSNASLRRQLSLAEPLLRAASNQSLGKRIFSHETQKVIETITKRTIIAFNDQQSMKRKDCIL